MSADRFNLGGLMPALGAKPCVKLTPNGQSTSAEQNFHFPARAGVCWSC